MPCKFALLRYRISKIWQKGEHGLVYGTLQYYVYKHRASHLREARIKKNARGWSETLEKIWLLKQRGANECDAPGLQTRIMKRKLPRKTDNSCEGDWRRRRCKVDAHCSGEILISKMESARTVPAITSKTADDLARLMACLRASFWAFTSCLCQVFVFWCIYRLPRKWDSCGTKAKH